MKKYIVMLFGFMIVGVGCALTLKANIGMGAWDALSMSTANIVGLELGTAGIVCNSLCVLGQFLLLKKKFSVLHLMQIPCSILLGCVVNLVAYELLQFEIHSFFSGLLLFLLANLFCAMGVSMVMLVNQVTFALEGFCMAVTRLFRIKFHVMRQCMDVFSILCVCLLTWLFDLPLSIGAGTILGMLMFGPLLGVWMRLLKPLFYQAGLIDPLVEQHSIT